MQTGTGATQPLAPLGVWPAAGGGDIYFYNMFGSAYLSNAVDSGQTSPGQGGAIVANIYIPTVGAPYTFSISHDDGAYFGFVGEAASSSYTPPNNINRP